MKSCTPPPLGNTATSMPLPPGHHARLPLQKHFEMRNPYVTSHKKLCSINTSSSKHTLMSATPQPQCFDASSLKSMGTNPYISMPRSTISNAYIKRPNNNYRPTVSPYISHQSVLEKKVSLSIFE